MNRPLLPIGLCLSLFLVTGCILQEDEVKEPDAPEPVAADTVSDLYAYKSAAAAASVSDLYAFRTLPSVKTVSDLRADSTAPAFTYFSFQTGAAVADSNAAWDLAFRSTTIKVNGKARLLDDADFDKLEEAPDSGYGDAVAAWYDYSGEPNHTITPKAGKVLVVKGANGRYAKVEILSYYKGKPAEPNGLTDTARYYTFRYLAQTDSTRSLKPAADPAPATYFSLKTGKVVEDSTQGWDLAFRSTSVRVSGEAQLVSGDFDKLAEAPSDGYAKGAISAWYDYSGEPNHTITPKAGMVLVIKTAEGKYAKVQFTSYYKGSPSEPDGNKDAARYYSFRFLLQADGSRNLAAAANPAPYTYFSLKTGEEVEDSTQAWDLAFRATSVRVGPGVSAQLLDGADFDLVKEAPESGYSSGSLPAWYDYSGEPNHTITPKLGKVLAVKTADGKYAKVQFLSYYKGAPSSPNGLNDEARYYTFRYVLQADGSRKLD
jgi:hypothetical protein